MKRRKFTKEFKSQLIKEAIETGNSSVVGRKHNISPSVVSRWVRKHKGDPMARMTQKAVGSDNVDLLAKARESKDLEKQNHRLKKLIGEKELEIEILRDTLKKTNAQ